MRVLTCLTAALLATIVISAQALAGSTEDDQNWHTCISVTTPPDEKVTACGAIIDAGLKTLGGLPALIVFAATL